ncbi:MAG: LPS export ABC transporter periplasmic protein LptC, partial [Mesorhizobium sp.]
AFADGKLVMANPKLNGFTKQNLPYSMTALRAIQDVSKQGIIDLEGIKAKLPIAADNTAAIDATHGTYDRDGNTLSLTSDVTVSTTDGVVAKFKSVY